MRDEYDFTNGIRGKFADPGHSARRSLARSPGAERQTPMQEYSEFSLPRTGDRHLSFRGWSHSSADGKFINGRQQNRWFEIEVYLEHESERWIGWVRYVTQWEGEVERNTVYVENCPDDLAGALKHHPYMEGVLGYPPGDAYSERRDRLDREMRHRWEYVLTEVLGRLPAEWLTPEERAEAEEG